MPKGDKSHRQKAPRERDLGIIRRYQDGETLNEIGRSLGLTRERIRQILWREVGRGKAKAARQAIRKLRRVVARTAIPSAQCIVCWAPMKPGYGRGRGGQYVRLTCGPECAEDYRIARYHLSAEHREKQRLRTAAWVLDHPDRVPAHVLRFNQKIASGEPIGSNGHWTCKGSKAEFVMARIALKRAAQSGDWHIEFPQPETLASVSE